MRRNNTTRHRSVDGIVPFIDIHTLFFNNIALSSFFRGLAYELKSVPVWFLYIYVFFLFINQKSGISALMGLCREGRGSGLFLVN